MSGIVKVFFRGFLAVFGTVAAVAIVWGAYIQRDALASALAPASELVNSLRGVSQAPDSEPASAPRVVAPPIVEPPPEAAPAAPPGAPAND